MAGSASSAISSSGGGVHSEETGSCPTVGGKHSGSVIKILISTGCIVIKQIIKLFSILEIKDEDPLMYCVASFLHQKKLCRFHFLLYHI